MAAVDLQVRCHEPVGHGSALLGRSLSRYPRVAGSRGNISGLVQSI